MTEIYSDPNVLREALMECFCSGETIGFVPTLGALHEGHRTLLRTAKSENDRVVCSIFVNPTQFDTDEDAEQYPRDPEQDNQVLEDDEVDFAFRPTYETMYPSGDSTHVEVDLPMTNRYEGEIRPRFFDGVARVVSKLLNLVPATRAYFGEKDLQQYIMIRRMVADLQFPHEIRPVPVVRDENGIAFSSRNLKFDDNDWKVAAQIYDLMNEIKQRAGELTRKQLKHHYPDRFDEVGYDLQYLESVSFPEYAPTELDNDNAVLIVAGYTGDVRIKDNLPLHAESVRELEQRGFSVTK